MTATRICYDKNFMWLALTWIITNGTSNALGKMRKLKKTTTNNTRNNKEIILKIKENVGLGLKCLTCYSARFDFRALDQVTTKLLWNIMSEYFIHDWIWIRNDIENNNNNLRVENLRLADSHREIQVVLNVCADGFIASATFVQSRPVR